jgi:hypothetical protein
MKKTQTSKLVYTALCVTLGILLPQIINLIPIGNVKAILLPMHIPVLLAGFLVGIPYATACGIILPPLVFLLTGMPPIYPIGLTMMFELGAYGAVTAIIYKYSKGKIYPSLIGGMIIGRIVLGIASTVILGFAGKPYGMSIFLTSAFVTALPGIIIQLIVIPAIVYALKKAKILA